MLIRFFFNYKKSIKSVVVEFSNKNSNRNKHFPNTKRNKNKLMMVKNSNSWEKILDSETFVFCANAFG